MQTGELGAEATTLVVRSSKKVTRAQFLGLLNRISEGISAPRSYNYVYLPWTKLAIVNFDTPQTCARYLRGFQQFHVAAEELGIRFVGQAIIQGLPGNLALFVAKAGMDAAGEPGAPSVYQDGVEIPIAEALDRHVTPELVLQYQNAAQTPTVPDDDPEASRPPTDSLATRILRGVRASVSAAKAKVSAAKAQAGLGRREPGQWGYDQDGEEEGIGHALSDIPWPSFAGPPPPGGYALTPDAGPFLEPASPPQSSASCAGTSSSRPLGPPPGVNARQKGNTWIFEL